MNELALSLAMAMPFLSLSDRESLQFVQGLGHDEFQMRQRAETSLRKKGIVVIPALRHGLSHNDIEISSTCRRLLEEMILVESVRYGKPPWIDSMWMRDNTTDYDVSSDRFRSFRCYLDYAGGCDPPPYENYRKATGLLINDWIRDGVPHWWIESQLSRMRKNDKRWTDKNMRVPEDIPPPHH